VGGQQGCSKRVLSFGGCARVCIAGVPCAASRLCLLASDFFHSLVRHMLWRLALHVVLPNCLSRRTPWQLGAHAGLTALCWLLCWRALAIRGACGAHWPCAGCCAGAQGAGLLPKRHATAHAPPAALACLRRGPALTHPSYTPGMHAARRLCAEGSIRG